MIYNWGPISQALVASLFTWGVTALGAAVVFFIPPYNKKLLDVSLGFAAGVMTAASFWSLLAPAIELAETEMGSFAFVTVGIGFAAGAAFVCIADRIMPSCVLSKISVVDLLADSSVRLESRAPNNELKKLTSNRSSMTRTVETDLDNSVRYGTAPQHNITGVSRRRPTRNSSDGANTRNPVVLVDACADDLDTTTTVSGTDSSIRATEKERALVAAISWRRIVLLIVAVTVHNIPEGLAVGVAFGSIGKTAKATFESAFTLALGIGLQNFPEGLAVSLPLAGFGHSKLKSFFYGQLSGMVEPVAALGGAAAVILMEPALPYALSFAAGAMIYVVVDDIIPEAQRNGNGKLASLGAIIGFLIMMSLDVGLG